MKLITALAATALLLGTTLAVGCDGSDGDEGSTADVNTGDTTTDDAASGGGDTTAGPADDDTSTGGAGDDDASIGGGDDASMGGGHGDDASMRGTDDDTSMGGTEDDSTMGGGDDDSTMGGTDDDAGGTTDGPLPTGGCLAAAFLDVSSAPGAGAAYADPFVEATCDGDTMTVSANSIPHYTFIPVTPNALTAQNQTYELPIDPEVAAETTEIPLLGYAGVAVNGCPFFGPNEAAQPADSAWGDPVYNGITDDCLGHTANEYHFHALSEQCLGPQGLVAEPWLNPAVPGDQPSPILGFAADGFPIYGSYGCEDAECTTVVEYKSSWDQIGDPTKDAWDNYAYAEKEGAEYLDQCNGHYGPNGDYHYHATEGFPYIIGCYAGTPGGATGGGDTGGDPGGDPPDGGGPTTCTSDLDCDDACEDGYECGCTTTPMGNQICVASCDADGDCPGDFTCNDNDLCVPAGGPGGGGGPP